MEWINQLRDSFKMSLTGCVQQSSDIVVAFLAAGVCQRYPIPSGATMVVFGVSGGSDLWMQMQATSAAIAVPTANIAVGVNPELISSAARAIRKTDAYISLISPVACIVSMSFYASEMRQ
jgi:hypothetical protein